MAAAAGGATGECQVDSILIVDDAPLDQEVAARYVHQEGFEVRLASNGREALEAIGQSLPSLVLTDLYMPEMDGLELVTQLRRTHSGLPVILMTGRGTDDTAVRALQTGAASYIPKRKLRYLGDTVRSVLLAAAAAASERPAPWTFLSYSESHYVLGYEPEGRSTMVGHFEEELTRMDFCDAADRLRVGTALAEALANAIEHGNLELDSSLRESTNRGYYELGQERSQQPPFSERSVSITSRVTPSEITYVIADEGPGFDHRHLPDPTDPENLTKLSGRGLLLIQTFMDEVHFNDRGNQITMVKRRGAS
jgi:CheY-like chemotaxis protein